MAAQRKTPRTATANGDSPSVDFNLDTFELEAERPFAFVLGGRRIQLKDPNHIDWHDLADIDGPVELANICMGEEDREFFLEHPLPTGKLNELMRRFQKHTGIGNRGNADA